MYIDSDSIYYKRMVFFIKQREMNIPAKYKNLENTQLNEKSFSSWNYESKCTLLNFYTFLQKKKRENNLVKTIIL